MYRAGYSQRKLAVDMGMSKNTVNAICTGKRPPNVEEVRKMCALLNVNDKEEKVEIFLS